MPLILRNNHLLITASGKLADTKKCCCAGLDCANNCTISSSGGECTTTPCFTPDQQKDCQIYCAQSCDDLVSKGYVTLSSGNCYYCDETTYTVKTLSQNLYSVQDGAAAAKFAYLQCPTNCESTGYHSYPPPCSPPVTYGYSCSNNCNYGVIPAGQIYYSTQRDCQLHCAKTCDDLVTYKLATSSSISCYACDLNTGTLITNPQTVYQSTKAGDTEVAAKLVEFNCPADCSAGYSSTQPTCEQYGYTCPDCTYTACAPGETCFSDETSCQNHMTSADCATLAAEGCINETTRTCWACLNGYYSGRYYNGVYANPNGAETFYSTHFGYRFRNCSYLCADVHNLYVYDSYSSALAACTSYVYDCCNNCAQVTSCPAGHNCFNTLSECQSAGCLDSNNANGWSQTINFTPGNGPNVACGVYVKDTKTVQIPGNICCRSTNGNTVTVTIQTIGVDDDVRISGDTHTPGGDRISKLLNLPDSCASIGSRTFTRCYNAGATLTVELIDTVGVGWGGTIIFKAGGSGTLPSCGCVNAGPILTFTASSDFNPLP
ncbi:hypothetical protein EBZ39_06270 [bacterium]|nr:hypothetical protein [bacterium]